MKHLKHLKHILATWPLLGRMEARRRGGRRRRMDLDVQQRHMQLVGGPDVTRIWSSSPACWSIIMEALRLGGGSRGASSMEGSRRGGSAVEAGEADWIR
jgi:hypothetical protein